MDERQDRIEGWTGDFVESPACREFPAVVQEYAPQVLVTFFGAACAVRDVDPDEIEEGDLKPALLEGVGGIELPGSVRAHVPELVGSFLEDLQTRGRFGGGYVLAGYVRVLKSAFLDQTSGKPTPYVSPGSRLGRNDPCPCGSGKKYKKCCMGMMDT